MTDPTRAAHWDSAYSSKDEDQHSWFEPVPALSLDLARPLIRSGEPVIDIGGGRSRFALALLDEGFGPCTLLDVSQAALDAQSAALAAAGHSATLIAADITQWQPDTLYRLWHDRAVFHFLTAPEDRAAYVSALRAALPARGHAIIATFDETGPERCSGLPVVRYSPETLFAEIDRLAPGAFEPVRALHHVHHTPAGRDQAFQTSVLRRTDRA